MAKKHETLTEQAEELSRKLAAARLRALMREKERRRAAGTGARGAESARELLDGLDGRRVGGGRRARHRLAGTGRRRAGVPQPPAERGRADQAFRAAVDREAAAREHWRRASRTARLDGVDARAAGSSRSCAGHRRAGGGRARARRAERSSGRPRNTAARWRTCAAGWGRRLPAAAPRWKRSDGASVVRARARADGRGARDVRARIQTPRRSARAWRPTSRRVDAPTSPLTRAHAARAGTARADREDRGAGRHPPAARERRDLLEARRRDIEETAGSRFLGHPCRARDRSAPRPGEHRGGTGAGAGRRPRSARRRRGLRRRRRAIADAPEGDGAIFAIAKGGPVRSGSGASARCSRSSRPSRPPAASRAPCSGTSTWSAPSRRPSRSSGAPGGVVRHARGRADRACGDPHREGGRRACPRDPRRAEGAGSRPRRHAQRPQAASARLDEIGAEVSSCRDRSTPPTVDITSAAERSAFRSRAGRSAQGRGDHPPACGRARGGYRRVARASAAIGRAAAEEMPELPRTPQQPVSARVAVETLRRDRATLDARLLELRSERDALAAHDPIQLRAELEAAESARADGEAGDRRGRRGRAEATRRPRRGGGGRARRRAGARPRSTGRGARRRPSWIASARRTRTRTGSAATSSDASPRPSGCCAKGTRPSRRSARGR